MSIDQKTQIIKEILSENLSQEKRREISEMDSVEKELKNQWVQCGKQVVPLGIKAIIWKNINIKCRKENDNQVHIVL